MRVVQKHKMVLSFLALVSFSFLMCITALPLKSETDRAARPQVAAAPTENQPGAIEQNAPAGHHARKKRSPIIPIIIGVVVVGAAVAVLALVVLKTKYDIRGSWLFTYQSQAGWGTWTYIHTFTGSRESGTFTNEDGYGGTYTVSGKTIIDISYYNSTLYHIGQFSSQDAISGDFSWSSWDDYGTWAGTRISDAAANTLVSGTQTARSLNKP